MNRLELPKPLSIEDLISLLESHIAECEETLKTLKETRLQHPEHIKLREYNKEKFEKKIEELNEDLDKLRKIVRTRKRINPTKA
jgi:chromosome segregation ATPase